MTAPQLEHALAGAAGSHEVVQVDLGGLVFDDCAGLRPLRRTVERSSGGPTSVRVFGAPPRIDRLLRLTGVGRPTPVVGRQGRR